MPEAMEPQGKPVFLINGFLEAGKTQFLKFTLEQDYFQTEGKTLLILCEEGEEEYPADLLRKTNTVMVTVSSPEEVTPSALSVLDAAYDPERIIIEWNGMWPQDDFRIPEDWFMNQIITLIDTSTLDLYMKNMKPLMGQMLRFSELVLCNRADDIPEETLGQYRMSIKAMAQNAEIVFEGAEGEIRGDFSIDLPYDLDAQSIDIKNEDFGVFFLDAMDRTEKYDGKTVSFTGQVMKPAELPKDSFIPGRMVMTCCEADVQFLGLLTKFKGTPNLKEGSWVKVVADVRAEENEEYGGMGPVLYAKEVLLTGPVKEIASF